jgi:hypothetical protein
MPAGRSNMYRGYQRNHSRGGTVTLKVAGQGYTGNPICTISGGGGKGATCKAVIEPGTGATAHQPRFGATPGWDMATGIGS